MLSDLDIYRVAQVLIREHGLDATVHAAMRADALASEGDIEGYAVWKRVVKAVDGLLAGQAVDGSAVH